MRKGKKVIVPGDGSSLWVITHNTDFAKGLVGLLGNPQAIGHAFHITTDEVMTWDQFYRIVGAAAGVEPQLIHIPTDFIGACLPDKLGGLMGDKAVSVVFDNSKIKRFVPGYCATVPFAEGIRRTLAWFDADPARRQIDADANERWDKLIAAYEQGAAAAARLFQGACIDGEGGKAGSASLTNVFISEGFSATEAWLESFAGNTSAADILLFINELESSSRPPPEPLDSPDSRSQKTSSEDA